MDIYHITKRGDKWQFKKKGAERAVKHSDTKSEAIKHMQRYMSNKAGVVRIYDKDDQFQKERNFQRKDGTVKSLG